MEPLKLRTNVEYEVYGTEPDLVVEILLTVEAGALDVSERAPTSLTAVLDRSGSMAGSKLHMVLETNKFMVTQTSSCDRLSIVTYDSQVEELYPLRLMNPAAKTDAQMLLQSVRPGSTTNLSGGLLKGLAHQQELETEEGDIDPVRSLILFTDGLANVGITNKEKLLECLSNTLDNRHRVQIHTLGFGADHDADLLQKIADAGSGNYYFIESPDEIPTAFADVLGGISSVNAQNVELHISPSSPDIVVERVLSGFGCKDKGDGKSVSFGDMYAEERKDVLVRVKIPGHKADVDKEALISVNLSYCNVKEAKMTKELTIVSVKRSKEVPAGLTPSPEVIDQRCRFAGIEAMQLATQAADKGKLEDAKKILKDTKLNLEGLAEMSKQAGIALEEMNKMMDCLGNREVYTTVGGKKMRTITHSHMKQRSSPFYRSSHQADTVTSYNTSVVAPQQNLPFHPARGEYPQLPVPTAGPNSGGTSTWLGFMRRFSQSGRQLVSGRRGNSLEGRNEANTDTSNQGTRGSYTRPRE